MRSCWRSRRPLAPPPFPQLAHHHHTTPAPPAQTLFAALQAVGDTDISDLPADVLVVAPVDAAFAAALKVLDLTAADLLADKETLLSILANHIAGVDADGMVETVAGEMLDFTGDGAAGQDVAALPAAGGFGVTSEASGAGVEAVIRCPGQTVLAADAVLAPATMSAGGAVSMPGMAPTPLPEMVEEMMPNMAPAPAAEMVEEMVAPAAAPMAETAAAAASSARKAAFSGAAALAAALLA